MAGHELTIVNSGQIVFLSFVPAYLVVGHWETGAIRRWSIVSRRHFGLSCGAVGAVVTFGFIVGVVNGIPQRLPERSISYVRPRTINGDFSEECFANSGGKGLAPSAIGEGQPCRIASLGK